MIRRLAVFATHPIQYQVPVWKALAAIPGLATVVHYFSDHSVRGEIDPGFGTNVAWDIPMLDGYEHRFIQRDAYRKGKFRTGRFNPGKLLVEGRFDSVLLQGYINRFERAVAVSAKALNIKTVLRADFIDLGYHRGIFKSLVRPFYLRWFYKHIDAFCYFGKNGKRHLLNYNIPEDRTFFAPHSVDSALFHAQSSKFSRTNSRRFLGISDDETVLLFCGKLIPLKMPQLILDAVERLEMKDKLALIVVGDGPLRASFEERASTLFGQRLYMAGFVNQSKLGRYYSAADIFILPSEYETWGLVVNEAMYFGLPVIVSNRVGCHPDLVIEGKTGYVFAANDANDLAEKISLAAEDRRSLKRMGENAARHIGDYSTERGVQGILQAIGVHLG